MKTTSCVEADLNHVAIIDSAIFALRSAQAAIISASFAERKATLMNLLGTSRFE